MVLVEKGQEGREGAVVETVVTVLGGVTGDVSESPDARRRVSLQLLAKGNSPRTLAPGRRRCWRSVAG